MASRVRTNKAAAICSPRGSRTRAPMGSPVNNPLPLCLLSRGREDPRGDEDEDSEGARQGMRMRTLGAGCRQ
eukprot:7740680-Pyramimonas_sp.AAC.1